MTTPISMAKQWQYKYRNRFHEALYASPVKVLSIFCFPMVHAYILWNIDSALYFQFKSPQVQTFNVLTYRRPQVQSAAAECPALVVTAPRDPCLPTLVHLGIRQQWLAVLGAERDVGEPHRGGEREGHGEPDEAAGQEAPHALLRSRRHAALPVRLVDEHRTEVTCETHGQSLITDTYVYHSIVQPKFD